MLLIIIYLFELTKRLQNFHPQIMDLDFSENTISVVVKKERNSCITLLENVPSDRIDKILSACRSRFGCGGSIVKESARPAIQLQGDQKFNIEKTRATIFDGLELRSKDKK